MDSLKLIKLMHTKHENCLPRLCWQPGYAIPPSVLTQPAHRILRKAPFPKPVALALKRINCVPWKTLTHMPGSEWGPSYRN